MPLVVGDWDTLWVLNGDEWLDIGYLTNGNDMAGAIRAVFDYEGHTYAFRDFGYAWRWAGDGWVPVELRNANGSVNVTAQLQSLIMFRGEVYVTATYTAADFYLFRPGPDAFTFVSGGSTPGPGLFYHTPNAVTVNPFHDEILVGYSGHDAWSSWSPEEGARLRDDHGGSCNWSFGYQSGKLWSGHYAGLLYGSTDGHTWTLQDTSVRDSIDNEAELWTQHTFKGRLHATGCSGGLLNREGVIMKMNAAGNDWDTVYREDFGDQAGSGIGFVTSMVSKDGNLLYVGCGSEPWYYRRNWSGDIFVATWDGVSLTRLPENPEFSGGIACIADVNLRVGNALRQFPRDDGLGAGGAPRQALRNGPTSRQGSIRQGRAGTYE